MKDEIYNIRQLHSEAVYETWLRFKKKLQNVPNHRMSGRSLLEIFYRALNSKTKAVADTITSGAFMSLRWEQASEILDYITKTNRGWHTREADTPVGAYAIGASVA